MTKLPDFAEVYRDAHDVEPFPWQIELCSEVLAQGWPDLLDLPTGVGKTSALDVALYALAAAPERMPRRTVLVVDRRIVVDQGAAHARRLRRALAQGSTEALRRLANALRAVWDAPADEPPFAVALLRGGMPRDDDWARRPDQPVLGVSTVDQVGSRLLFRGYGVSPRSASIHAGLLGSDTLFLLDEVHLAEPFAQTLAAIASRLKTPASPLPDRCRVVRMSATPGAPPPGSRTFALTRSDRSHPVLQRRLSASKRARLEIVKVSGDDETQKLAALAEHAAKTARDLVDDGARVVGLVLNRVDAARRACALLGSTATVDTLLVTGRMRPLDRDRVVRDVLVPRAGPRARAAGDRPLIVVATQCIEAGADLDFDGLVTECASLDALRQRFGRLDRRGDVGESKAVVLCRSDLAAAQRPDPVYGPALAATWLWLHEKAEKGLVDFGLDHLPPATTVDGAIRADLLAPRPDAPVLLPAHVDAWAQTSPVPDYDPDIALWLHGPERTASDVQIIWREGLVVPDEPTAENLAAATGGLAACRPSTLEAVSVPLHVARAWLSELTPPAMSDLVAADADGDESDVAARAHREGSERPLVALRWQGDSSAWVRPSDLRPGDVLIVPCERGGLANDSFDPTCRIAVTDLRYLGALRARGEVVLWFGEGSTADPRSASAAGAPPVAGEEETARDHRARVREWAGALPESPNDPGITPGEWSALVRTLRSSRSGRVAVLPDGSSVLRIMVPPKWLRAEVLEAVTEDDDSCFLGGEVTLAFHSGDVRRLTDRFARALGFTHDIAADLGLAAWLHDVGKADPRFQRWLVGGSEVRQAMQREPLAKSALGGGSVTERRLSRIRAGLPAGYRHELLSTAMAEASASALSGAHDPDLVVHLVASHHGFCRPFAPADDHPEDIRVELTHGTSALAAGTRHRLARLDSGVSDRFWRLTDRYGWWGLAWLEAVLRLADHRSSDGSMREEEAEEQEHA